MPERFQRNGLSHGPAHASTGARHTASQSSCPTTGRCPSVACPPNVWRGGVGVRGVVGACGVCVCSSCAGRGARGRVVGRWCRVGPRVRVRGERVALSRTTVRQRRMSAVSQPVVRWVMRVRRRSSGWCWGRQQACRGAYASEAATANATRAARFNAKDIEFIRPTVTPAGVNGRYTCCGDEGICLSEAAGVRGITRRQEMVITVVGRAPSTSVVLFRSAANHSMLL